MFSQSSVVNDDSACLRRDSISEFSKDTGVLGLNHILADFDKKVSSFIHLAYDYIGELNLLRANRPDVIHDIKLNKIRSVSINYIREQIREKISDDDTDFSDSQIEAMQKLRARVTKQVYDDIALQGSEIQFEGYCGEHAYLLLSSLLEQGLPSRNLRVINMEGIGGGENDEIDHSFLAYCSHGFEDNRDIESIMRVICSGHKNALFLNPWGEEKIISLNMCERKEDFFEILNKMMLEVDAKFDVSTLNIAVDIPIDISDSTDSDTDISDNGSSYSEYFSNTALRRAQYASENFSPEAGRKRTSSDADKSAPGEPPLKKLG